MSEPAWLPLDLIIRLHDRQIELHGGLAGTRDHGLLESAVARPLNAWSYGEADLFTLASLYAAGLIRNHPFLDGNKRVGHLAMEMFMVLNGQELIAEVDEQERVIVRLAAGELSREQFAEWVRSRMSPYSAEPGVGADSR